MASQHQQPAEPVWFSRPQGYNQYNNGRITFDLPSETVMGGDMYYELNENLEIEKWYRPAAPQAPASGMLSTVDLEETQDRSEELRARWEEKPEVPKDKVPDEFVDAEYYLLLDRARRAAYEGYQEPSDLHWPEKLPSHAHLSRISHRRPRPRPTTTAAKARERGGAVRPEPMFWGGDQRRVTLGRDYRANRMIKHIVDGARAKTKAAATRASDK